MLSVALSDQHSVWLRHLSREGGKKPVTLADIDDATIDGFAQHGFDWIWLLSVWQTGPAGRAVSRSNLEWRAEFNAILPDLVEDDICGSGFAITAYTVSEELGAKAIPLRFRDGGARSAFGRATIVAAHAVATVA